MNVLPTGFHPGKSSDGHTYCLVFSGDDEAGWAVSEGRWESDEIPVLGFTWLSGKVRSPRAVAYQTLRLRAADSSVETNVKVFDKQGTTRADIQLTEVDRPVRIPGGWRSDEIQIQVSGSSVIESVGIWDSMAEAQ